MPNAPRLCPAVPRRCSVSAPVGERVGAEAAHDLARDQRADRAVGVAHRALERQQLAARQRVAGQGEHLAIERRGGRLARDAGEARGRPLGADGGGEQRVQVDAGAAVALLAREVGAADEILEAPHAELRHQLAHLLGHEQQVLHDVLRRAGEAPAQLGILRRDAHRAGVEVADAHHDAARGDQRGGREAELLGAEQRADDDVAPRAQAAVDLQPHAPAQRVADQHLLRLGEAELPGHAGVPDRRRRRGAGAAVHAGDHDVVGAGLGDARGDRADARRARRA